MTSHNTKENPARNIPSEAFGYTIAQGVCPRVSQSKTKTSLRFSQRGLSILIVQDRSVP